MSNSTHWNSKLFCRFAYDTPVIQGRRCQLDFWSRAWYFVIVFVVLSILIFVWWLRQPQPLIGYSLKAVSMISPTEGWAVGERSESPSFVIVHYTHQSWQIYHDVHTQIDPSARLTSISMLSASEGWAVGSVTIKDIKSPLGGTWSGGIILHYINGVWQTAKIITDNTPLQSVTFRSATDGWTVGYSGVILHYDGTSWNDIKISSLNEPQNNLSFTTVVVSGSDVWCAGYGVIFHYDGNIWRREDIPTGAIVHSLTVITPNNIWAIFDFNTGVNPLYSGIWIEVNGQWVKQDQGNYSGITDFAINAAGNGWIVGTNGTIVEIVRGASRKFQSPTGYSLAAIAMVTPNDSWAVGDFGTIIHYHHGTWEVVNVVGQ